MQSSYHAICMYAAIALRCSLCKVTMKKPSKAKGAEFEMSSDDEDESASSEEVLRDKNVAAWLKTKEAGMPEVSLVQMVTIWNHPCICCCICVSRYIPKN